MKERVLLCLLAVLMLGGCTPRGERNYFAYRETGFAGEVRGCMNGVSFVCEIDVCDVGSEWQVRVCYLAPEMLAGTVISAVCDRDGTPIGEMEFRRTGDTFRGTGEAFAGLLRPATAWVSQVEIASVQKTGGEYLLSFEDGGMMRLREDGTPLALSGKMFTMEMCWMERQKRE